MTTELTMLVYAAGLLLVLILIQASVGVMAMGLKTAAGPRDETPPPTPFQGRTRRVVDNHREGLTLFAPIVLAAAVAGVSNEWTVLGAQLFFYSRVAHAVIYLAGLPMVRPLAYFIGLGGTIMVLLAAIGVI
jgi:uncharacterized MAPEG superfamily protein